MRFFGIANSKKNVPIWQAALGIGTRLRGPSKHRRCLYTAGLTAVAPPHHHRRATGADDLRAGEQCAGHKKHWWQPTTPDGAGGVMRRRSTEACPQPCLSSFMIKSRATDMCLVADQLYLFLPNSSSSVLS